MRIYDTLKKRKVDLTPIREGEVSVYLCGPTVYDYGHLGHGRSAVVFDVLRRYLIYRGLHVTFVRNWTDIDDKTIARAAKEGVTVRELTERFITIYREDFARLNIQEPDVAPKPTEHIEQIVSFIARLVERGHGYVMEDGVYFDIGSLPGYGSLSGQSPEEMRSGARVEVDERKRNPGDFALWKFEKPGEPAWPSPWGRGRPGWHIECSVMATHYLGEEFDIHCGGQDLIFPHHTDEIAQARGAGYGFARHWMHNGFLNIDDEKMSKSLGNFLTLRDTFERYPPATVRFFLVSAHYRAPLSFSNESLEQAGRALGRYNDFILRLREIAEGDAPGDRRPGTEAGSGKPAGEISDLIRTARSGFEEAMDDDLNVSRALASLSELVREANLLIDEGRLTGADAASVLDFMRDVDRVLAVFTFETGMLPAEIERLIEERAAARRDRNFARADEIRDDLLGRGIVLEDTPSGTRWKKSQ
jgi:cysteinyl-tRNA synthetase